MISSLWIGVAICCVLVVVLGMVATYRWGKRSGAQEFSSQHVHTPVWSHTNAIAPLLDQILIVTTQQGVVFCDARAQEAGIVVRNTIVVPQIRDLISLVQADHTARERIVEWENNAENKQWKVTVSILDADYCVVLINTVHSARRLESITRDFVGNVSHELKTPIGAINLLAETIHDASDDPETVQYFSDRILFESTRLNDLVQKLIELGRSENPKTEITTFVLIEAIREAIEWSASIAERRNITVEIQELSSATLHVRGSRIGIATAFKNLIENAINYSPQCSTVNIDITSDKNKAMVRVIDRGSGIPAAALDRIFERFYRVDPARSRETGGTGLGLSIAQQYIRAAGGEINVWSQEGQGSTFTVVLPLV